MAKINTPKSPHFWKGVGETEVMVLLHSLTEFLAPERRNNLPDGFEDIVRWFYNQFEVMLGFFTTYYEEADDRALMATLAKDIRFLVRNLEFALDLFYTLTCQKLRVITRDDLRELKGDVEGIVKRIRGLMLGGDGGGGGGSSSGSDGSSSNRFEYERTREKVIQVLNQRLPRTTRGWVVDPETYFVVDFSKHSDRLVDRVINGGSSTEQLDVIVIQGLRNKGINTLLEKFYNDASIANNFETRAWVKVPPVEHNLRDLLLSILRNIIMDDITPKEKYNEMEVWELKRELVKQLISCKYLILLEWVSNDFRSNVEWNEKKDAFPKNNKGSRVILATTEVFDLDPDPKKNEAFDNHTEFGGCFALTPDCEHLPYSVSQQCNFFLLKEPKTEDYWNLLSKMIFGEKECPEELGHLGRKIIECCERLPNRIVLMACILRIGENTNSRWSNFVAQLEQSLEDSSRSARLLAVENLCYQEMPQHLKMCFLSLSVFPKNIEISVKQLIQMWIAEGLIPWVEMNTKDPNKQAHSSMEDVAEKDYLEALIALNFIQVTNRRSDGGPKSFRISEVMGKFCYRQSIYHNHGHTHFDSPPVLERFGGLTPRRLSILKNCEHFLKVASLLDTALESDSNKWFVEYLRSFSCFSEDTKTVPEQHWESFFVLSVLLRVLNLGEEEVGKLPKAIERLFHLRYLRVKPTRNIGVPRSIFNLRNLQTIDLRTTRFSELPKGIWWMRQLRHLYLNGDGPSRLPIPESEECVLPNLQTLSYISIDADDGIHISKKAPNLRKLGLYGYQYFSMSEQEATFNLSYLQKLKFAGECNFEVPITFPHTITKISTGKGIHLQQDMIKMFGKLSNLQILKMAQTTFDDGELVFEEGSFPQLQLLKFEASNIVTWRIQDGAMPKLLRLIISKCPQLTEPPAKLWKVNTLQELDLSRASMKFAKKVGAYLKENAGSKLVVYFPLSSKSGA